MNIETANRLVNLRKEHNLSQEALAEKLGISRQAVSKWERAEASPDTDNLITLARLYGMSLDDLLNMKAAEAESEQEAESEASDSESTSESDDENEDVHFGSDGFRYQDSEDKVHIGWHGIHVSEKNGDEVNVGWNGIHVKEKGGDEVNIGRKWDEKDWNEWRKDINSDWKHDTVHTDFPIAAVVIISYIILGFLTSLWHPLWIMLLAIPFFSSVAKAIRHRSIRKVSYFTLVLAAFLVLGCVFNLWNPAWVLFLTVPLYHSLVKYFSKLYASHKAKKDTVTE